jgi:putative ABC transport system permease protein
VGLTTAYAVQQDWGVVLPWQPVLAGLGCSLLVGTVVGLYPALRAASVPPTEALRAI